MHKKQKRKYCVWRYEMSRWCGQKIELVKICSKICECDHRYFIGFYTMTTVTTTTTITTTANEVQVSFYD